MVELIGYLMTVAMMTFIPAYRFICIMLRWVLSYVKSEIRSSVNLYKVNWEEVYPHDLDRLYKKVAFLERKSEGFKGLSFICLVFSIIISMVIAIDFREQPFVEGYLFSVERISSTVAPVVGWITVLIVGVNLFGYLMGKYTKFHLLVNCKRK